MISTRLGRFRRFPGSTRFQIENRNHSSTLLKNRVPASVGSGTMGSGTETIPFPRAAAPVKYRIPKAGSRSRLRQNTRFWGPTRLQLKYPVV